MIDSLLSVLWTPRCYACDTIPHLSASEQTEALDIPTCSSDTDTLTTDPLTGAEQPQAKRIVLYLCAQGSFSSVLVFATL